MGMISVSYRERKILLIIIVSYPLFRMCLGLGVFSLLTIFDKSFQILIEMQGNFPLDMDSHISSFAFSTHWGL